jgi:hypothetical protein
VLDALRNSLVGRQHPCFFIAWMMGLAGQGSAYGAEKRALLVAAKQVVIQYRNH